MPYAAYGMTTKTLAKKKIMPKTFQFYTKTSFVEAYLTTNGGLANDILKPVK